MKENTMTPDEAIAQQIKPYADAAGKYIGEGWHPRSTLTPGKVGQVGDECALPDGRTGIGFAISWSGPGVADIDDVAHKIQADWKALGIDVEIETDDSVFEDGPARILSDPPYHTGAYPDGYGMTLTIGTHSTFFETQTHCLVDHNDPEEQ